MTYDLPTKSLIALRTNNLLASLGLDRRIPITLETKDEITFVDLPDRKLAIPSPIRWKMYKRGLQRRLDRLLYQFGVDDHVTVNEGDVVFDIGANVGEFSLAVAAKGASVVAIEGDPFVYRCLMANVGANTEIRTVEKVLWKEETELIYYSEPNNANSSVFEPPETDYAANELRLQATTLDKLAADIGVDRIDLLKCDAEGAEPEVIEGGRDVLSRTRQVVFDTGAERMGEETSDDVQGLLENLGFRVVHDTRPNRKMTFGIRD
ncbi:MAG: FkbM family methyltransferase [Paracoccaceae bacterium]|nr:FkbM family methyltransferase [Paracoccaceae bacterium]